MRPLLTALLVLTLTCLVAEARQQTQDLVDVPLIRLDQGQLAYLRDPSRAMTLDQARDALAQGRFQGLSANLGIGYVPDAVWLYFRLERQADQPSHWWLELMPTYLDSIELFYRTPHGAMGPAKGRRSAAAIGQGNRLPWHGVQARPGAGYACVFHSPANHQHHGGYDQAMATAGIQAIYPQQLL